MERAEDKVLGKHPALTPEQIKNKLRDAQLAKNKYSHDMTEIGENLIGFKDVTAPLIDPETDKILGWMRFPTNEEMFSYFQKYGDLTQESYDKKSPEEKVKMADRQFELMAELIVEPKHEAEWWKKNTTAVFGQLFAMRLEMFFDELGQTTENF